MPMNKTTEGLIYDLAKYALKGIKGADPTRAECETELAERIRETITDWIQAIQELDDE